MKNAKLLAAIAGLAFVCIGSAGQDIQFGETLKVTPADGTPGSEFGVSVAIDQGVMAVGAHNDDANGADSGSVYLYDANTGVQLMKLLPDDGMPGARFGCSVAIAGGVVAVGAVSDVHNGVASGSAYLFDAASGDQIAKLTPSDGAEGDEFGISVAIEGGVVIVGAKRDDDLGLDSGSVYLFDTTGVQLNKILADDGTTGDNFGGAVAIDGGIVAVGAHTDWNGNIFFAGSAYLFDATTGGQLNKLVANNPQTSDFFGSSIDIDNGLVVVGAWAKSVFFDHSGAAYVFDAASGSQLAYIVPADGHDRDHFGISVAIDDGVVAIGAHQDGDNGWVAGSAYLYDAFTHTLISKLLTSDGEAFDYFGTSIAIDNGLIGAGAIGDADNGEDSGSVYLFDGVDGPCTVDFTGEGTIDLFDLFAYLELFNLGDLAADFTGDGAIDVFDVFAFLDAFNAGCP
ncbi:MAG: FG-GAP repeat protein [Phycisphaerales bacterium]|nr:FG-GAP repeat protein [Phycisphaerales bacterium]